VRRAGKLLLLAFVAIAAIVGGATPASAHATFEGSTPAPNESVPTAPDAVVLRFTEGVSVTPDGVQVFDGDGEAIDVGDPGRENGDAATVRVPLPDLADGQYVVTYRVTSEDSHPVDGSIVFAVGDAPVDQDAAALAGELASRNTGQDDAVAFVYGVVRFLAFASLALFVGVTAFLVLLWPDGWGSARVRRMVWVGWAVALVTSFAGIGLQGAYTTGGDLADALDPSVFADVLDTRFGKAWFARAVMLVLAAPVVALLAKRRARRGVLPIVALALGAGIAITPALSGHASAGRWVALAIPLDGLHVFAMSVWLGGLAALAVEALRSTDVDALEPVMDRFSRLAMTAVAVLVVTGGFQAVRQLESWDDLLGTSYGKWLLVKLGAFAGMLVVASASRDIVRFEIRRSGRLALANPMPAGPGAMRAAPELPEPQDTVRRLRTAVWYEIAFAAAILAITAVLVNAAPVQADTSEPYLATLRSDTNENVRFEVQVSPAQVGPNQVHITALDPNGELVPLVEVAVALSEPSRGIAPIDVDLLRIGTGGHYQSTGVSIPFEGRWRIDVRALVTDVEQVTVSGEFDVGG
jgi:copper transport protein